MARKLLSESEGYILLKKSDVPVPEHVLVRTRREAEVSASGMQFPLVLKIVSPDVIHKSDVGGVITNIAGPGEAGEAFEMIVSSVLEHVPSAKIEGVILEHQMPPGLELIVGGKVDPTFGKIMTFGLGGTMVEILRDISIRLLPADKEEITRMVRGIAGYRLISGYRNFPPLDEKALVDAIFSISNLFNGSAEISEFDINPLILYKEGLCAVDARIYIEEDPLVEEIRTKGELPGGLFSPGSIAVVGASSDPRKIGYAVLRNLLPFPGKLYPVNPKGREILGRQVFKSVTEIPGPVDLAIIAIPAPVVPGAMQELGRIGTRSVIIVSSGFREAGEAGGILEKEVIRIAKEHGIRIIGPNTLGIMLPHKGINTTFDPITPRAGHIGFISQSGAIITTIVDWSIPEEIGFSAVISVGNQSDLGFVDYLRFVADDPDTRAIILYIEEIRDGREFFETVREVVKKKPVIALKSGASKRGKRAASSHTGSLAGSYEVYNAAFRQAGVIPVISLNEAFEVAELLASEGYPKGNRAVVITGAGGFAVLASDYAEINGIELTELTGPMMAELNAILPSTWSHENPIDIIGDSGAERYARTFDMMIRHQDEWDIAFVIAVPSAVLDPAHLGQEIVRFSKSTHKMIVGCLLGGDSLKRGVRVLRDRGIPNYGSIEDAFKAVGRAVHKK